MSSPYQLGKPTLQMREVATLEGRIKILEDFVRKGVRNPLVRAVALEVVSQCPARNDWCEIGQLYYFVKQNVRYTQDIFGIDTYQHPARTMQWRGGDCDDASVLLCALLSAVGFQTGFRVISVNGKVWEHIYGMVGLPKGAEHPQWYTLDTTVPSAYPSWQPKKIAAAKDFKPIRLI